MRKKIIAGNWKMNYTTLQSENFISEIKDRINTDEVDVVICPNFVSLETVSNLIDGTSINLGAQNVFAEQKGAYTGETSADMLLSVNVKYCIIGHSERRLLFNETNDLINKKALVLLQKDINPIICVGETLEQRDAGRECEVVKKQITECLKDIPQDKVKRNVVIAYEPIWAIGTGKTATELQAQDMCKYIRSVIAQLYDNSISDSVRIQYGGSVNPNNVKKILSKEDIDGVLVGGASLTNDFVSIVNY